MLDGQNIEQEPEPVGPIVASLYVRIGLGHLSDSVNLVSDAVLFGVRYATVPWVTKFIHFVVERLQLSDLGRVLDAFVANPFDLGHVVPIFGARFDYFEASGALGSDDGATVSCELVRFDVEQTAVLGVVKRCRLAVHAHAKMVGARLDGAANHQSILGLIDVEGTRSVGQSKCANKNGNLVFSGRDLFELVKVLTSTFGKLGWIVGLNQSADEQSWALTAFGQILFCLN